MEFTQAYNDTMGAINNNNEREIVDETYNCLNIYLDKYKHMNANIVSHFTHNDDELKLFRHDTKIMFDIIQKSFASEDLINHVKNEVEEDELYIGIHDIETAMYLKFVHSIKFINNNIDTVDLINPSSDFVESIKNAISYMNQKQKDMEGLNEALGKMGDTLVRLEDTLRVLN
jgi:hypothetical protein